MSNNEINQQIQEAKAKMTPEQFEEYREQRKNDLVLQAITLREQARYHGDMETVAKCTAFLNKALTQALVDDFAAIYRQQEVTLTLLFSSVFTATIISLIGLSICYLILKFLLSKDPKPADLIIISCFSSAPGLLVFFALISSNIVAQFFLIMIPGIYALITFASGLKQVYLLRNIEVVLLLVTLIFSGAILGPM